MDKGLVSIVLPVFNGEKYIASSIQSILMQSYPYFELIVVNDCSTDNTLSIVSEYALKDNRIKIINNSVNKKLPGALNVGFKNTLGEYYTWTSDDNIYKSDALKIMVNELKSKRSLSMVYCDFSTINSDGKLIGSVKNPPPEHLVMDNPCGACFLYTSRIAKTVGDYDTNMFLAEDYDYWIRILKNGKIKHIDQDLYYYRLHDASLTETRKKYICQQTYKVLLEHFDFLYKLAINRNLVTEFCDYVLYLSQYSFRRFIHIMNRIVAKHRALIILHWVKYKLKGCYLYNYLRKLKRIINEL